MSRVCLRYDVGAGTVETEIVDKRNKEMRIALVTLFVLMPLPSGRAEDSARIYVYAKFGTAARSWLPISCDGPVVAKLKHGKFLAVDVAPGQHVLGIASGGVPVVVDVRPGEESFVRLGWHRDRGAPAIPVLGVVEPAHAHREMNRLRCIDADKALSKSVPKADPRDPPRLRRRGESADTTP